MPRLNAVSEGREVDLWSQNPEHYELLASSAAWGLLDAEIQDDDSEEDKCLDASKCILYTSDHFI